MALHRVALESLFDDPIMAYVPFSRAGKSLQKPDSHRNEASLCLERLILSGR